MGMNFLRRDWNRHPKLGKKRKSKQVWRRPKGRDNKMREKRKGYPKVVSVGYEKEKTIKEKINDKDPVTITKVSELESLEKEENKIAVVGRVGKKRRTEIAKKAKEKGIELANLNPKKFLKKVEFEEKKKKEKKDMRTAKKKAREEKEKKQEKTSSNEKETAKQEGKKDEGQNKSQEKQKQESSEKPTKQKQSEENKSQKENK